MDNSRRAELMDMYFTGLDEDDFDHMKPCLSEEVQFRSSSDEVSGVAEFREYLEENRMVSNSTHEITRRVHDDTPVSICEGRVSGDTPDGSVEGAFCDVFEFDPDSERITSVSVYTRL
jgi:ketosteroid isomerase-like protein